MIEIKKLDKNLSSGKYGAFIPLKNKKGVKVFKKTFKTLKLLLESEDFMAFFGEYVMQARASEKVNFVPRCYKLEIVKIKNSYTMGIVMDHIEGDSAKKELNRQYRKFLALTELSRPQQKELFQTIKDSYDMQAKILGDRLIKKARLDHRDKHVGNMIVGNKRLYLVDFSDGHVDDLAPSITIKKQNNRFLKKFYRSLSPSLKELLASNDSLKAEIKEGKFSKKVLVN